MISFGYLKLTFDVSMVFIRYDCRLRICARAHFAHVFCLDVLITVFLKWSAYKKRGLFLGRYCDVSSYKGAKHWKKTLLCHIRLFSNPYHYSFNTLFKYKTCIAIPSIGI